MQVKRPPADLSFDDVRRRSAQTAFYGPGDEHAASNRGPEQSPPAADAADASTPAAGAETADTRPATPSEQAPAAGAAAAAGNDTHPKPRAGKKRGKSTKPAKPGTPQSMPATPDTGGRAAGPEQVKIKGYVPMPANGVSRYFDNAIAFYGERIALRATLDKALTPYADALRAGTVTTPLDPYRTGDLSLETSRRIDTESYDAAKAILDPMDMLGDNAFGAAVMKNALAFYLAQPS